MPKVMPKQIIAPETPSSSTCSAVKQTAINTVKGVVGAGASITAIGWMGWGIQKVGNAFSNIGTLSNAALMSTMAAYSIPLNKIASYSVKKIMGNPEEGSLKSMSVETWTKIATGTAAYKLASMTNTALSTYMFGAPTQEVVPMTTPAADNDSSPYAYLIPVAGLVAMQALLIVNHRLQKSISREDLAQLEASVKELSEGLQNTPEDKMDINFIKKAIEVMKELGTTCEKLKRDPTLKAQVGIIETSLDKCLSGVKLAAEKLDLQSFEAAYKELKDEQAALRLLNTPESKKTHDSIYMKAIATVSTIQQNLRNIQDPSLQERVKILSADVEKTGMELFPALLASLKAS